MFIKGDLSALDNKDDEKIIDTEADIIKSQDESDNYHTKSIQGGNISCILPKNFDKMLLQT